MKSACESKERMKEELEHLRTSSAAETFADSQTDTISSLNEVIARYALKQLSLAFYSCSGFITLKF